MKPWITLCLAFCSLSLGLASWLEATTQSYPPLPILPHMIEAAPKSSSNPKALNEAASASRQAHLALQKITIIDTTPEELRSSFTRYWSSCLKVDTESLTSEEENIIRNTLQEAHLKKTKELTAELKHLHLTRESSHLMTELVRGIRATSNF